MMQFTYLEESRARYNELLRDAEAERQAMRFQERNPQASTNQLLLHVSNWLIDSGSWLKQRAEMRTSLS